MPRCLRFRALALALMLGLGLVSAPAHGTAQDLPLLTPADYDAFEIVLSSGLSPDGTWLAYRTRRGDDFRDLRLRPLAEDSVRVYAWGGPPSFSPDSRWVAWAIGMSEEERTRLEEAREPVRNRMGLLETATGRERTFDAVRAFAFDPTGQYLALHGYPPEAPSGRGGDLRLLDLDTGSEMHFGSVGSYAWNEEGTLLALIIQPGGTEPEPDAEDGVTAGPGQALHLWRPDTGVLRVLDHASSAYRHLAWRDGSSDLAVLRSDQPLGADTTAHSLLVWRELDRAGEARALRRLEGAGERIPEGLYLAGITPPSWLGDQGRVQIGLRPTAASSPPPEVANGDTLALPSMQLWHTRDVRIIPQQKLQANAVSRSPLVAVWDLAEDRVVQVGTNPRESATVTEDGRFGVERVREPYPWGAMFGRPYMDVWTVDLDSGERRQVLEEVRYAWESAEGGYLLTFDGTDYHAVNLATGSRVNLTGSLDGTFANTEYDTPTDMLPPHGVGGWLEGDEAVLLYDRHDVWRVAPDGSGGRRLTDGAEASIIHRVVRLDTSEPGLDPDNPIYLSLRGEWTERRGYARLLANGSVERLLFEDRLVTGLLRADSAEVYLWREEARDRSPNLFVSGPALDAGRRLTDLNPFLADFAWTRSELLDFESEAGERLQGVLLYPANHDPGRSYPMIVYTYEMLSPGMHSFQPPSERSYYNFTVWTQRGYFVLLPDIRYRARDPGVSAIEALRPAVGTVVERGLVDPARVGLIGHSWGGYQATYVPTRTDLFAASVAGAPLTDFVSFMGQIHWNAGLPEPDHWETGQGRMEVPYWEDPEAHHRNSPLHAVHEMETPLLMAHGDDDGVVEFFQSTLFYNYARRAGRQMVLLVYHDEDHSFQQKPNQVDYHRRILEWFGHYLKGEPAPRWITEGIPWESFDEEMRRVAGDGGG